jgi:WD40 repeat protein
MRWFRWLLLVLTFTVAFARLDAQPKEEPETPPEEPAEVPLVTGKVRLTLEAGGHTSFINRVLFTPDGKYLLSAGSDHTIRVWDLGTGQTVRVLRVPGSPSNLYPALSPDGQTLAVNARYATDPKSVKHIVYLLALADGRIERVLQGHTGEVRALCFSADGKRLASAAADRTIRIWDPSKTEAVQLIQAEWAATALAFSPDGARLAEARPDNTAVVRDLADGQVIELKGAKVPARLMGPRVAWSPDGKTLATASEEGVELFGPDGRLRHRVPTEHRPVSVVFSADSRRLIAALPAQAPHRTAILNVETGKVEQTLHPKGAGAPLPMWAGTAALSPDGARAATTSNTGSLHEVLLWNTASGQFLRRLGASASWLSGDHLRAGWVGDGPIVAWHRQEGRQGRGGGRF